FFFLKSCGLHLKNFAFCLLVLSIPVVLAGLLQPYAVIKHELFIQQISEQIRMVRGTDRMPWSNQYYLSAPYIYYLIQIYRYTMGPLEGLAALLGFTVLVTNLRERSRSEIILLSFLVVFFFQIGAYEVKFQRYLLPIYPLLAICAAYGLVWLNNLSRSKLRPIVTAAIGCVLIWSSVKAVARAKTYLHPFIHITASREMCDNIPSGSKILQVSWDSPLPDCGHLENPPDLSMQAPEWELDPYDVSQSEELLQQYGHKLSAANYLVMGSTRVFRGVLSVPEEYPLSAALLKLLASGWLGYELIATYKADIKIGSWYINDDLADESLVVHDRPKVYLFKNVENLDPNEIVKRISHFPHPRDRMKLRDILALRQTPNYAATTITDRR
ncbi:MAG: hypothetical protein KDD42_09795, partial [Bdellovibrionales bacterium]|nr:hypothetical protein [Bdellovibrionales bacterium]